MLKNVEKKQHVEWQPRKFLNKACWPYLQYMLEFTTACGMKTSMLQNVNLHPACSTACGKIKRPGYVTLVGKWRCWIQHVQTAAAETKGMLKELKKGMLKNGDDESQQHVEIAAGTKGMPVFNEWKSTLKNGHAESSMLKLMQKKTWKGLGFRV